VPKSVALARFAEFQLSRPTSGNASSNSDDEEGPAAVSQRQQRSPARIADGRPDGGEEERPMKVQRTAAEPAAAAKRSPPLADDGSNRGRDERPLESSRERPDAAKRRAPWSDADSPESKNEHPPKSAGVIAEPTRAAPEPASSLQDRINNLIGRFSGNHEDRSPASARLAVSLKNFTIKAEAVKAQFRRFQLPADDPDDSGGGRDRPPAPSMSPSEGARRDSRSPSKSSPTSRPPSAPSKTVRRASSPPPRGSLGAGIKASEQEPPVKARFSKAVPKSMFQASAEARLAPKQETKQEQADDDAEQARQSRRRRMLRPV